jgi:hypothetical protein
MGRRAFNDRYPNWMGRCHCKAIMGPVPKFPTFPIRSYWGKRMSELRSRPGGQEEHVRSSKAIGW